MATKKELKEYTIWISICVVIFIFVYGLIPLDVTNDKWIINGYTEYDIVQHYAGWIEYRNADWCFPLGKIPSISGDECSNYISFTDSIPLVAIICKVFRKFLPGTFQYFGWYILLCFMLQSFFTGKIIKLFNNNRKFIYLSCILMTLSPILLERAFRHTALASHWLILAALYLYFKDRNKQQVLGGGICWAGLNILAILIHPYFVPIIMGIMCAQLLENIINFKKRYFAYIVASMASNFFVGVCIGLFGSVEVMHTNDLGGYGYFSMNMNAFINPISQGYGCFGNGNSIWSVFLKPREQILGNYDGFNYFGIGIIGSLIVCVAYLICNKPIRKEIICKIEKYYGLVIVAVILLVYALSNVLVFDDKIIFTYNLPHILYPIMSSFKASSRFFYPIYYLVYIIVMYFCGKVVWENKQCIVLSIVILAQIIDFSAVIIDKRMFFTNEKILEEYSQKDRLLQEWKELSKDNDKALILDPCADPSRMYLIAYAAGMSKIKNNFNIMNRGSLNDLQKNVDYYVQQVIIENELDEKTMCLFLDMQYAEAFKMCMGEDYKIRQLWNDFYWVYKTENEQHNLRGNIDLSNYNDVITGNISIDLAKDKSKICGWTFMDECDSKTQQIFLLAESNEGEIFIPVRSVIREDVSQYFNNEKYKHSGFEIYLSDKLKESTRSVYLIVINEDKKMIHHFNI